MRQVDLTNLTIHSQDHDQVRFSFRGHVHQKITETITVIVPPTLMRV
jgi:hypothetical protein